MGVCFFSASLLPVKGILPKFQNKIQKTRKEKPFALMTFSEVEKVIFVYNFLEIHVRKYECEQEMANRQVVPSSSILRTSCNLLVQDVTLPFCMEKSVMTLSA
jgi:hypothetical protein